MEVARIRPNGTGFQLLTNNTGIDDLTADWAPDGSTLAVWSDVDGDFEIYTLPAAGGSLHRVTRNRADDVNAFWLPSGNRIVFNREDAERPGDPLDQTRRHRDRATDHEPRRGLPRPPRQLV